LRPGSSRDPGRFTVRQGSAVEILARIPSKSGSLKDVTKFTNLARAYARSGRVDPLGFATVTKNVELASLRSDAAPGVSATCPRKSGMLMRRRRPGCRSISRRSVVHTASAVRHIAAQSAERTAHARLLCDRA
jgi:hypothetical protein